MLKNILLMLSVILFVSCNSMSSNIKKSFSNNNGVLVIPFEYERDESEADHGSFANSKVAIVIKNLDTNATHNEILYIATGEENIVVGGLSEGKYKIESSYLVADSRQGFTADWVKSKKRRENIFFTIMPQEFTVLSKKLNYASIKETDEQMELREEKEGANFNGAPIYWTRYFFTALGKNIREEIKAQLESDYQASQAAEG